MNYFLWFVKLRFVYLKNSLFKDLDTIKRTLTIAVAIIIGQIVLTRILYRTVFSNIVIMEEMINGLLVLFFGVIVIWIYLISFSQSISTFIQNFYKSPDMNYLITIPIPFNYVFLFKFFEHNIHSTKAILFLIFPFLTALGLWVDASFIYYLSIIPIYFLISIIPSVLGVVISMISLRFIPAKVFNTMLPIFTFATNISFAIFFTRAHNISTTYIIGIMKFFENPWVSNLVPPTAGIKLFYASLFGEWSLATLLLLLVVTIVSVVFAFVVSKKMYLEGWMNNQLIDSDITKKKRPRSNKENSFRSNPVIVWIETEWKMAIRNYDMLMGSFFMFLFYIFAAFTLIYGDFFLESPIIGVSLLILIASVTNIMAISILFIPAEIKKDKNLWKRRYWLLKIMPLKEKTVFDIQLNMLFIPGFIISLLGIIAYSVMSGVGISLILFSAVSLIFILYGSSSIYVCGELVSLTEFFEKYAFLGNLATFLLPILYGILSVGIMTMFLARDFLSQFLFLYDITTMLNLPIAMLISVISVFTTYLISKRVFIKVWSELEI